MEEDTIRSPSGDAMRYQAQSLEMYYEVEFCKASPTSAGFFFPWPSARYNICQRRCKHMARHYISQSLSSAASLYKTIQPGRVNRTSNTITIRSDRGLHSLTTAQ